MKLNLDKDGYIIGYALIGSFENSVEVSNDYIDKLDIHKLGYLKFTNSNELPQYDKNKFIEHQKQEYLENIRIQREIKCFPIINRGEEWKEKLTKEQRQELESWYKAWLLAPQTLKIPEKPTWLK